jgi:hypothetical protein
MAIGKVNKVAPSVAGSDTTTVVDLYSFDGQTRSNSTTVGAGWTPSGTHSNWVTGTGCIDTQGNASAYWKTALNSETPFLTQSEQVDKWNMGPYAAGEGTQSNETGPRGGHASSNNSTDGLHAGTTTENFPYTETSSGKAGNCFVMRTPAYNFTDYSDANELYLQFYLHAVGSAIGEFVVYEDTATTSRDNLANLLARFRFPAYGAESSSNTRKNDAKGYLKTSSGIESTAFFTYTYESYYDLTSSNNGQTSGSSNGVYWQRIRIPLHGTSPYTTQPTLPTDYRTTTNDRYFYFVHEAAASVTEANNIRTAEGVSATFSGYSTFEGDLAIDDVSVVAISTSAGTVGVKKLNKHEFTFTGTPDKLNRV